MKDFDISTFNIPSHEIPSILGFDAETYASLMALGKQTANNQIMELEFVSNMGVLLTGLSFAITNGKETNVNWRFSQYGVLYTTNNQDFSIVDRANEEYVLNQYEFGFVLGMSACNENILWAINNQLKNPFKMSYFYFNFLNKCLDYLNGGIVNKNIILKIVNNNEPDEFKKYKNNLHKLLDIPVTGI